jgi:HIRAN domain
LIAKSICCNHSELGTPYQALGFFKKISITKLLKMIRKDFLRSLLGFAGVAILPAKKILLAKKTLLLQFHIRGFQYYEGPILVHEMKPGEALKLVREPKNKFDANAIALHYRNLKIGFVPAEKNEVITRLLDSGTVIIKAEIISINPEAGPWEVVYAGIYVEGETRTA